MKRMLWLLLALSLAGCTPATKPPPALPKPEAPAPPAAEAPASYPRLPPPAIPLPSPPYSDDVPHPADSQAIPETVIAAATAKILAEYPSLSPFQVGGAWFISPELTLAAGHLANGRPGLIRIPKEGDPSFVGIPVVGAPGPPAIKGVKGDWVLIAQGLGYQVYNYKTGELDRSDETATPVHRR